jgi:UDP-2,3-diacylglucosamine hydrolase
MVLKLNDMNNVYFVSDIHLGLGSREDNKKREELFVKFLDSIKIDAHALYIVGDLFDFWFEYRRVVPKGYFNVIAKLYELSKRKIEINYLVGNHDCLVRDYFEVEAGMNLFRIEIVKEIAGKKFYIHHGDGLSRKDFGYKMLKTILRSRFNQWLFSLVHPDLGIWLGMFFSKKSRGYTKKKDYGPVDGLSEFASKKISEGYDYVIMGHVHNMINKKIGAGYYINLGDWITNFSYAVFDGKTLQLRKIEIA